jgi:hypothetical protein
MEADWEVEVGGGAPVIDALWAGFVDLRQQPKRIGEITEAGKFPALGDLLTRLNSPGSPVWTAKCDLWEPVEADEATTLAEDDLPVALAIYVDLLPCAGDVFQQWQEAAAFCRAWAERLARIEMAHCTVDLVVRQAIAGTEEGFGVTAYVSADGDDRLSAAENLCCALGTFADAIPAIGHTERSASRLQ